MHRRTTPNQNRIRTATHREKPCAPTGSRVVSRKLESSGRFHWSPLRMNRWRFRVRPVAYVKNGAGEQSAYCSAEADHESQTAGMKRT